MRQLLRNRHAGDHRRRPHRGSAPAVDHEPAVVKQPDADAGPRAAIEPDGIGRDIERKVVQSPHGGRDRERELRAGAEPGMRRNGFEDVHPMAAGEAEIALHRLEIAFDAIAFRPRDLRRRRAFDRDARLQIADRDADAAEATSEPAVQIEKAEVQSCRYGDRDARRVPRGSHLQASAPEVFMRRGFFFDRRRV